MHSKDLAKKYLDKIQAKIKTSNSRYFNIKCPICNEGHSPFKSRGYVLFNGDRITYYCHNCLEQGISFHNFLSQVNSIVAQEFKDEVKRERLATYSKNDYSKEVKDLFGLTESSKIQEIIPEPIYRYNLIVKPFLEGVYTISSDGGFKDTSYPLIDLPEEAILYLYSRGFKEEDFSEFKFIKESGDIVVPMWYDKEKNEIYGMQMRSIYEKRFHNQNFRDNPKVWNLMYCLSLPKGYTIYVAESVFDAMSTGFNNILGAIGRTLSQEVINMFKDYKLVFLFDADEAGDKATLKFAEMGYSCLLHQKMMYDFKDFNKVLELGQTKEQIQEYIKNNIASPLKCVTSLKLRGISLK